AVLGQGVAGEVEVKRFFLILELLRRRPLGHVGQRLDHVTDHAGLVAAKGVEQVALTKPSITLPVAACLQGTWQDVDELGTAAEAVAGSGLDELLQGSLADHGKVKTVAQVEDVLEGPALLANTDDLTSSAPAQALDGGEAKDDLALRDCELDVAGVDV